MLKLVILQIKNSPQSIKGRLQRVLLEIAPGVFVGRLPVSYMKGIWKKITSTTNCSAVCVVPAKTETGFKIAFHGGKQRCRADNWGIELIQYQKKKDIGNKVK